MVELNVRKEWLGKNLMELSLRRKYGINVVAVRKGEEVITSLDPAMPLDNDMTLIVIAETAKLQKLK